MRAGTGARLDRRHLPLLDLPAQRDQFLRGLFCRPVAQRRLLLSPGQRGIELGALLQHLSQAGSQRF